MRFACTCMLRVPVYGARRRFWPSACVCVHAACSLPRMSPLSYQRVCCVTLPGGTAAFAVCSRVVGGAWGSESGVVVHEEYAACTSCGRWWAEHVVSEDRRV